VPKNESKFKFLCNHEMLSSILPQVGFCAVWGMEKRKFVPLYTRCSMATVLSLWPYSIQMQKMFHYKFLFRHRFVTTQPINRCKEYILLVFYQHQTNTRLIVGVGGLTLCHLSPSFVTAGYEHTADNSTHKTTTTMANLTALYMD
jgi:hypothetical protein